MDSNVEKLVENAEKLNSQLKVETDKLEAEVEEISKKLQNFEEKSQKVDQSLIKNDESSEIPSNSSENFTKPTLEDPLKSSKNHTYFLKPSTSHQSSLGKYSLQLNYWTKTSTDNETSLELTQYLLDRGIARG